jgi:hypothetical protein
MRCIRMLMRNEIPGTSTGTFFGDLQEERSGAIRIMDFILLD